MGPRPARKQSRPRAGAWFVAACLFGFAIPAAASWTLGSVGSWMIVERWDHGFGPKQASRVTTTLLRRDKHKLWFEHQSDAGQRWEDADSGSVTAWNTRSWARGRDQVIARDRVRLDGAWIPCRVILNENRSAPFSAMDPVQYWIARSKRWEAIDTTLRVRVLKAVDLGTELHYRDGRVEKHDGRVSYSVKTLHERTRIHGHSYDCWVQEWKTLTEQGEYAGRTTVWGCESTPAGWVRQVSETRTPSKDGIARTQEELVDYHFN